MERRADKRIPVNVEVRFFYAKMFYSGTIAEISRTGMLINTGDCVPPESKVVVIVRTEDEELLIFHGRVSRLRQIDGRFDAMGIEVLKPVNKYKEFVDSLSTVY